MKEYLRKKNMHNICQQYHTQFRLQRFAGKYSEDKQFASLGWLCRCQMAREEEGHLTSGQRTVVSHLTEKFCDLTDIERFSMMF